MMDPVVSNIVGGVTAALMSSGIIAQVKLFNRVTRLEQRLDDHLTQNNNTLKEILDELKQKSAGELGLR